MAKIPFDIKFRSQIESGKYKVVTGDDRSVRIISWDKKIFGGRTEIVGLVPTSQGDTETVQLYCPDGTLIASAWNEKFKLFVITPEPELSEFELRLLDWLSSDTCGEIPMEKMKECVKNRAAELLALARKELVKEHYTSDPRKTDLYKLGKAEALKEIEQDPESSYAFKRGVEYGKEEALKDLPRWKKYNTPAMSEGGLSLTLYSGVYEVSDLFIDKGLYIPISDLEKLPGFKED